jgi:hypothetical protein
MGFFGACGTPSRGQLEYGELILVWQRQLGFGDGLVL